MNRLLLLLTLLLFWINSFSQECGTQPMDFLPNTFTPNNDGVNDQLCYTVQNTTSFEFVAYDRSGNKVFENSGSISNNMVCVWDGSGACAGCSYAVIITFRNDCTEKSEAYTVTTFGNTKSLNGHVNSDTNTAENIDSLLNNYKANIIKSFDVHITPNQNLGDFVININCYSPSNFNIEIINALGQTVFESTRFIEMETKISTLNLNSGLYYVRVYREKDFVTKKMIVN